MIVPLRRRIDRAGRRSSRSPPGPFILAEPAASTPAPGPGSPAQS